MRDVYIIGTGIHPWMGFSEQVFADFAAVAVDGALKDANIEWQKIQAIANEGTAHRSRPVRWKNVIRQFWHFQHESPPTVYDKDSQNGNFDRAQITF